MGWVANVGCTLCRRLGHAPLAGTEVHHRRSGTGGGVRASDFDTMALCFPHHREHPQSFHALGTKGFVTHYGVTEDDLIADTRQQLGLSMDVVEVWKLEAAARKRKKSARIPLGLKAQTTPRAPRTAKDGSLAKPEKVQKSAMTRKTKWSGRSLSESAEKVAPCPAPKLVKQSFPARPFGLVRSEKSEKPEKPVSQRKLQGKPFGAQTGDKSKWASRKLVSRNTFADNR